MPSGVVSGVGRRMGLLDGGGDRRKGMGSFGVNLGRPIVTNGDGDALLANYFGEDWFSHWNFHVHCTALHCGDALK